MFCAGTNHQQTPTSEFLAGYGEEEFESERSSRRKLILRKSIYSSYMNGKTRLEPGQPYAGFPSVNGRPPDSENRYGQLGSPVSNNPPSPESMGGAAVEDPSAGGAEVPEIYTV